MKRYERNLKTLTEAGQLALNSKKVLVIGSGGLGGFVIEGLARMGIKTIGVCDYDVFDVTNLNRQLLSTEDVIGTPKVHVAKSRIQKIDSTINVITYDSAFPNADILKDFKSYDLVIDCLDNIKARVELEKLCVENDIKQIHGAVGGYFGTVAVISKENQIIEAMIGNLDEESETTDKIMGNPYPIVAIVGALEVHLAIKVLLDYKYLKKGFYYVDIDDFSIQEIVM